jgi:hypothetical protein
MAAGPLTDDASRRGFLEDPSAARERLRGPEDAPESAINARGVTLERAHRARDRVVAILTESARDPGLPDVHQHPQ